MSENPEPPKAVLLSSGGQQVESVPAPRRVEEPEPIPVEEVEIVEAAPVEPDGPTAFERAVDPERVADKPKLMTVGEFEYRCVPVLAARPWAKMVSAVQTIQLLKNARKSDPATAAAISDAFVQLIEIAEAIVIDEHWPHLDERLDSKTDPVTFPVLLEGIIGALGHYSGGKAKGKA